MSALEPWISTYTGKKYYPLSPRIDDIDLMDIAHALSMICRYTGHCKYFYSVAEHSVHVSRLVENHVLRNFPDNTNRAINSAKHALFHDAAEAYCNDIASPVKANIIGYDEVEAKNYSVIRRKFNISALGLPHEYTKMADLAILIAEIKILMTDWEYMIAEINSGPFPVINQLSPEMLNEADQLLNRDSCWSPSRAEGEFLARFSKLVVPV